MTALLNRSCLLARKLCAAEVTVEVAFVLHRIERPCGAANGRAIQGLAAGRMNEVFTLSGMAEASISAVSAAHRGGHSPGRHAVCWHEQSRERSLK